ncbi:hypothetical protein BGZ94_002775 [Podila epigama]|nr:hypothetical protein BGZ94_002775 [Podila epigama]
MPITSKAMLASTTADSKLHNSNINNTSKGNTTTSKNNKKSNNSNNSSSNKVSNANNSSTSNSTTGGPMSSGNGGGGGGGGQHHSSKKGSHTNSSKTNQRTAALKKSHSSATRGMTPGSGHAVHRSDSEDSYTPGGGFISEMDEHDSAFEGAMEYDEEDGRSLLGEEFDAGSDVADVQESKKEKRRRDFQERLLKLEAEFDENKHTIFAYQTAKYKEEMNAIMNGFHPEFHDLVEDFADIRDGAIEQARLYRDYQFECAQKAFELETELAEEDYMGEREGLREKMLAVIDGKRRALRDDKESLDITNAHHTRKLRRRGQEAEPGAKNSKRSKTLQPPGAKWQAVESDVLDDLGLIRKVTNGQGPTKKSGSVKKK